jgi:ParB family transcriptional regulator, chromosome partitioning protein
MAQAALDGFGFQDWRITERLDADRITTRDRRFALVGRDAYLAAGGRIEEDLFGELAPVVLDPDRLSEVWTARARAVALVFEAQNLAVHVTAGPAPDLPEDLETLGYAYGTLGDAELEAYRAARDAFGEAGDAAEAQLEASAEPEAVLPGLVDLVHARLAMDQAGCGGRLATALVFRPDARTGLEVRCLAPIEPEADDGIDETDDGDAADDTESRTPNAATEVPGEGERPMPSPEIEGVNHVLHGVRTETATRGLIRALADAPQVALTALIARLFAQIAVKGRARPDAAIAVNAFAFNPTGGRIIDALDGDVRRRLDERRAAWAASGETLIGWVHGLSEPERLTMLAELTALTLDVHETRTSQIRTAARRDAAELAHLCGANIADHWTPDLPYLEPHSKPLLLAMLEAMGEQAADASGLKKTALTVRVANKAAKRGWAPSVLSWAAVEGESAGEAGDDGAPVVEPPDAAGTTKPVASATGEGEGVFVVTPAGEAVLAAVGSEPLDQAVPA